MSDLKEWKDVRKEIKKCLTDEELEEIEFEKQIIRAMINARKKANLTQQDLSELSGIVQPSISKIEKYTRVPQYTTLMRLLRPMGYTLKVVPLKEDEEEYKKE